MVFDIVLFPNCDIHVALHGTPPLNLRVATRELAADKMSYTLADVTASCAFDFFAPYNPVGNRLQPFVTIDPATGLVTPQAVGINLVQVRFGNHYLIARLQVHDTMQGWWFGNASITTAKDATVAHAQPSIYALFSDDPTGTDLVGDITGHGYVTLTSSDNTLFTVNGDGRLQGLKEGNGILSGTLLGINKTLPVKVVDYGKPRPTLEYVQIPNAEHPETMHNILFIAEGFRNTDDDRKKFNKIVTEVVAEMFSKPRHAPYNLLEGSFNIWKAYEPSEQHTVTCGFQVNDEEVPNLFGKGFPIPYDGAVSENTNLYTPELLIHVVGLPLRNETRTTAQLKTLWGSQSLKRFDAASNSWVDNFDPNKVDDDLVSVWKRQKSLGLLEARDTFFGLYLGARYGEKSSRISTPVLPPGADNAADAQLAPFIARMYEWFKTEASRSLTPDPRRHPPELHGDNQTNYGNSILKYITSLRVPFAPHPNVGQEWMPDPAGNVFKKSRGLVALITNDGLTGGTNFNNLTITANTLAKFSSVGFEYINAANERRMRRTPPADIDEDIDDIINTVAHEFGHSFNLGDEYEDFPADQPDAYDGYDNLAALSTIKLDNNFLTNRKFNVDKIKWFDLLRMQVSDTLIKDSETEGGEIKVTIDRRFIGRWVEAKKQNLEAYLRKMDITPVGRQLPLKVGDDHYLVRLTIGNINQANGTILLGGLELPPEPFPVFPAGSLVFIPKRNSAGELMFVVEKKVLDKLKSTNLPLNRDTDTSKINKEADDPIDITDFKPPCKSYKLVGIYEGGGTYTGMVYRPSGLCKMRKSSDAGTGDGEFCHVCKYLIVNRVDPGLLAILDGKHYPGAKKGG
ncbi:MAG: hypothetical protein KJ064_06915 [Anaerolineae bacterium]|nr:hypothetical protein [Anaerolineae bacterium]